MKKHSASLRDKLAMRIIGTAGALACACAAPVSAQNISATQDTDAVPTGETATQPTPTDGNVDTTATALPTPAISSYRINPGDGIEIYVWGEERLQRSLTVLPDGSIAFPLVGQLRIAGLLPQDVERLVSERLRGQYRGQVPVVTVSVRETAGLQFSVMGKVQAPGAFTAGRYLNVLEALSLAGGPAEFANLDNVTLIREQGDEVFSTRLRLGNLFKPGVSARDVERAGIIRILPGDVLIVP